MAEFVAERKARSELETKFDPCVRKVGERMVLPERKSGERFRAELMADYYKRAKANGANPGTLGEALAAAGISVGDAKRVLRDFYRPYGITGEAVGGKVKDAIKQQYFRHLERKK